VSAGPLSRGQDVHSALLRRLLWNVVPVALVIGALWMALVGDEGLLKRHELKHQLVVLHDRTKRTETDNETLRRHIRALRNEPAVVQRASAETMLTAMPGSTIYRFKD